MEGFKGHIITKIISCILGIVFFVVFCGIREYAYADDYAGYTGGDLRDYYPIDDTTYITNVDTELDAIGSDVQKGEVFLDKAYYMGHEGITVGTAGGESAGPGMCINDIAGADGNIWDYIIWWAGDGLHWIWDNIIVATANIITAIVSRVWNFGWYCAGILWNYAWDAALDFARLVKALIDPIGRWAFGSEVWDSIISPVVSWAVLTAGSIFKASVENAAHFIKKNIKAILILIGCVLLIIVCIILIPFTGGLSLALLALVAGILIGIGGALFAIGSMTNNKTLMAIGAALIVIGVVVVCVALAFFVAAAAALAVKLIVAGLFTVLGGMGVLGIAKITGSELLQRVAMVIIAVGVALIALGMLCGALLGAKAAISGAIALFKAAFLGGAAVKGALLGGLATKIAAAGIIAKIIGGVILVVGTIIGFLSFVVGGAFGLSILIGAISLFLSQFNLEMQIKSGNILLDEGTNVGKYIKEHKNDTFMGWLSTQWFEGVMEPLAELNEKFHKDIMSLKGEGFFKIEGIGIKEIVKRYLLTVVTMPISMLSIGHDTVMAGLDPNQGWGVAFTHAAAGLISWVSLSLIQTFAFWSPEFDPVLGLGNLTILGAGLFAVGKTGVVTGAASKVGVVSVLKTAGPKLYSAIKVKVGKSILVNVVGPIYLSVVTFKIAISSGAKNLVNRFKARIPDNIRNCFKRNFQRDMDGRSPLPLTITKLSIGAVGGFAAFAVFTAIVYELLGSEMSNMMTFGVPLFLFTKVVEGGIEGWARGKEFKDIDMHNAQNLVDIFKDENLGKTKDLIKIDGTKERIIITPELRNHAGRALAKMVPDVNDLILLREGKLKEIKVEGLDLKNLDITSFSKINTNIINSVIEMKLAGELKLSQIVELHLANLKGEIKEIKGINGKRLMNIGINFGNVAKMRLVESLNLSPRSFLEMKKFFKGEVEINGVRFKDLKKLDLNIGLKEVVTLKLAQLGTAELKLLFIDKGNIGEGKDVNLNFFTKELGIKIKLKKVISAKLNQLDMVEMKLLFEGGEVGGISLKSLRNELKMEMSSIRDIVLPRFSRLNEAETKLFLEGKEVKGVELKVLAKALNMDVSDLKLKILFDNINNGFNMAKVNIVRVLMKETDANLVKFFNGKEMELNGVKMNINEAAKSLGFESVGAFKLKILEMRLAEQIKSMRSMEIKDIKKTLESMAEKFGLDTKDIAVNKVINEFKFEFFKMKLQEMVKGIKGIKEIEVEIKAMAKELGIDGVNIKFEIFKAKLAEIVASGEIKDIKKIETEITRITENWGLEIGKRDIKLEILKMQLREMAKNEVKIDVNMIKEMAGELKLNWEKLTLQERADLSAATVIVKKLQLDITQGGNIGEILTFFKGKSSIEWNSVEMNMEMVAKSLGMEVGKFKQKVFDAKLVEMVKELKDIKDIKKISGEMKNMAEGLGLKIGIEEIKFEIVKTKLVEMVKTGKDLGKLNKDLLKLEGIKAKEVREIQIEMLKARLVEIAKGSEIELLNRIDISGMAKDLLKLEGIKAKEIREIQIEMLKANLAEMAKTIDIKDMKNIREIKKTIIEHVREFDLIKEAKEIRDINVNELYFEMFKAKLTKMLKDGDIDIGTFKTEIRNMAKTLGLKEMKANEIIKSIELEAFTAKLFESGDLRGIKGEMLGFLKGEFEWNGLSINDLAKKLGMDVKDLKLKMVLLNGIGNRNISSFLRGESSILLWGKELTIKQLAKELGCEVEFLRGEMAKVEFLKMELKDMKDTKTVSELMTFMKENGIDGNEIAEIKIKKMLTTMDGRDVLLFVAGNKVKGNPLEMLIKMKNKEGVSIFPKETIIEFAKNELANRVMNGEVGAVKQMLVSFCEGEIKIKLKSKSESSSVVEARILKNSEKGIRELLSGEGEIIINGKEIKITTQLKKALVEEILNNTDLKISSSLRAKLAEAILKDEDVIKIVDPKAKETEIIEIKDLSSSGAIKRKVAEKITAEDSSFRFSSEDIKRDLIKRAEEIKSAGEAVRLDNLLTKKATEMHEARMRGDYKLADQIMKEYKNLEFPVRTMRDLWQGMKNLREYKLQQKELEKVKVTSSISKEIVELRKQEMRLLIEIYETKVNSAKMKLAEMKAQEKVTFQVDIKIDSNTKCLSNRALGAKVKELAKIKRQLREKLTVERIEVTMDEILKFTSDKGKRIKERLEEGDFEGIIKDPDVPEIIKEICRRSLEEREGLSPFGQFQRLMETKIEIITKIEKWEAKRQEVLEGHEGKVILPEEVVMPKPKSSFGKPKQSFEKAGERAVGNLKQKLDALWKAVGTDGFAKAYKEYVEAFKEVNKYVETKAVGKFLSNQKIVRCDVLVEGLEGIKIRQAQEYYSLSAEKIKAGVEEMKDQWKERNMDSVCPTLGEKFEVKEIPKGWGDAIKSFVKHLEERGYAHPDLAEAFTKMMLEKMAKKGEVKLEFNKLQLLSRLLTTEGVNLNAAMSAGKSLLAIKALVESMFVKDGLGTLVVKDSGALASYGNYKGLINAFGKELIDLDILIKEGKYKEVVDALRNRNAITITTYADIPQFFNAAKDATLKDYTLLRDFLKEEKYSRRLTIIDEGDRLIIDQVEAIQSKDKGVPLESLREKYDPLYDEVKNLIDTKEIKEIKGELNYKQSELRYMVDGRQVHITEAVETRINTGLKGKGYEYSNGEIRSMIRAVIESKKVEGRENRLLTDVNIDPVTGVISPRSGATGLQPERIVQDKAYLYGKAKEIQKAIDEHKITIEEGVSVNWKETRAGGVTTARSSPIDIFDHFGGEVSMISGTLDHLAPIVRAYTGKGLRIESKEEFKIGDSIYARGTQEIFVELKVIKEGSAYDALMKSIVEDIKISEGVKEVKIDGGKVEVNGIWNAIADMGQVEKFRGKLKETLEKAVKEDTKFKDHIQEKYGTIDQYLDKKLIIVTDVVGDIGRCKEILGLKGENIKAEHILKEAAKQAEEKNLIVVTTERGWQGTDVIGNNMKVKGLNMDSVGESLGAQLIARIDRQNQQGYFKGGKAELFMNEVDLKARVRNNVDNFGKAIIKKWENEINGINKELNELKMDTAANKKLISILETKGRELELSIEMVKEYKSKGDLADFAVKMREKWKNEIKEINKEITQLKDNPANKIRIAELKAKRRERALDIKNLKEYETKMQQDCANSLLAHLALRMNEAIEVSECMKYTTSRIYEKMMVYNAWDAFMAKVIEKYSVKSKQFEAAKRIEQEIYNPNSDYHKSYLSGEKIKGKDYINNAFRDTAVEVYRIVRDLESQGCFKNTVDRLMIEEIFKVRELDKITGGFKDGKLVKEGLLIENIDVNKMGLREAKTIEDVIGITKNFEEHIMPSIKSSSKELPKTAIVAEANKNIIDIRGKPLDVNLVMEKIKELNNLREQKGIPVVMISTQMIDRQLQKVKNLYDETNKNGIKVNIIVDNNGYQTIWTSKGLDKKQQRAYIETINPVLDAGKVYRRPTTRHNRFVMRAQYRGIKKFTLNADQIEKINKGQENTFKENPKLFEALTNPKNEKVIIRVPEGTGYKSARKIVDDLEACFPSADKRAQIRPFTIVEEKGKVLLTTAVGEIEGLKGVAVLSIDARQLKKLAFPTLKRTLKEHANAADVERIMVNVPKRISNEQLIELKEFLDSTNTHYIIVQGKTTKTRQIAVVKENGVEVPCINDPILRAQVEKPLIKRALNLERSIEQIKKRQKLPSIQDIQRIQQRMPLPVIPFLRMGRGFKDISPEFSKIEVKQGVSKEGKIYTVVRLNEGMRNKWGELRVYAKDIKDIKNQIGEAIKDSDYIYVELPKGKGLSNARMEINTQVMKTVQANPMKQANVIVGNRFLSSSNPRVFDSKARRRIVNEVKQVFAPPKTVLTSKSAMRTIENLNKEGVKVRVIDSEQGIIAFDLSKLDLSKVEKGKLGEIGTQIANLQNVKNVIIDVADANPKILLNDIAPSISKSGKEVTVLASERNIYTDNSYLKGLSRGERQIFIKQVRNSFLLGEQVGLSSKTGDNIVALLGDRGISRQKINVAEVNRIENSGKIAVNLVNTKEGNVIVALSIKEGVNFAKDRGMITDAVRNIADKEVMLDLTGVKNMKGLEREIQGLSRVTNKDITVVYGNKVMQVVNGKIAGEQILPTGIRNNLEFNAANSNYKLGLREVAARVTSGEKSVKRPLNMKEIKQIEDRGTFVVDVVNQKKGVIILGVKEEARFINSKVMVESFEQAFKVSARDIIVDLSNVRGKNIKDNIIELAEKARNENKRITLIDEGGKIYSNNLNINGLKENKMAFIRQVRSRLSNREIVSAMLKIQEGMEDFSAPVFAGGIAKPEVGAISAGVMGGVPAFRSLSDIMQAFERIIIPLKISKSKTGNKIIFKDEIFNVNNYQLQRLVRTVAMKENIAKENIKGIPKNEQMEVIAISQEMLRRLPVARQLEALEMAYHIDISRPGIPGSPCLKAVAETFKMEPVVLEGKNINAKFEQIKSAKVKMQGADTPMVIIMKGDTPKLDTQMHRLEKRLVKHGFMCKEPIIREGVGMNVVRENSIVLPLDGRNIGTDFAKALQKVKEEGYKIDEIGSVQIEMPKVVSLQEAVRKEFEYDIKTIRGTGMRMKIVERNNKNVITISKISERTLSKLVQRKGILQVADVHIPDVPVTSGAPAPIPPAGPPDIASLTPFNGKRKIQDPHIPKLPDLYGVLAIIGSN